MSQFDFEHLVETDEPQPEVRGSLQMKNEISSPGHVNVAFREDTQNSSLQEVHQHPLSDATPSANEKHRNNVESRNASHPVMYSTGTGNSKVVSEQIVIKQPNGENVIQTQQTCCQNVPERWRDIERQRPLRRKHIKLLKVFSVISVIVFFPLGIPAAYYAFQLQKEFDDGIMRGDIDQAQILRKRTERLIIFAFMFGFLVAVLVFALVERSILTSEDSMRNRVLPQAQG